jgi:anti-anti-sigma regulatory factor
LQDEEAKPTKDKELDLNEQKKPDPEASSPDLDSLESGLETAGRELILDLSCVSYLDQKGAGLIRWAEQEARRRGWWVGLVATPPQAALMAAGAESQIFPTYADAICIARRQTAEEEGDSVVTRL